MRRPDTDFWSNQILLQGGHTWEHAVKFLWCPQMDSLITTNLTEQTDKSEPDQSRFHPLDNNLITKSKHTHNS